MELSSKINVLSIRSQDEAQKGHPDIAQKWESELEALRFKMSAFLTLSLSMLVFSLAIAYIRIIKPLAELKSKMEKGENCAPQS